MPTSVPEYERVYNRIVALIRAGELKPGDRLPSIRTAAAQHEVSESTYKLALTLLGRDGWARGQQGKATFVADDPPISG